VTDSLLVSMLVMSECWLSRHFCSTF